MITNFEVTPDFLSVEVIYPACQYLRGDVTLDYLRRRLMEIRVTEFKKSCADIDFITAFEVWYAQLKSKAIELKLFKYRIHQYIGGLRNFGGETGTESAVAELNDLVIRLAAAEDDED